MSRQRWRRPESVTTRQEPLVLEGWEKGEEGKKREKLVERSREGSRITRESERKENNYVGRETEMLNELNWRQTLIKQERGGGGGNIIKGEITRIEVGKEHNNVKNTRVLAKKIELLNQTEQRMS